MLEDLTAFVRFPHRQERLAEQVGCQSISEIDCQRAAQDSLGVGKILFLEVAFAQQNERGPLKSGLSHIARYKTGMASPHFSCRV